jgi:hypothetical protein
MLTAQTLVTERNGTEDNGRAIASNTKTTIQLEAVEPHIIAVVAIFFGGELYRG